MSSLKALIAEELHTPVDPRVSEMAAAIAARHPGALGVLFYGSCLRDATLSGMLDFYLIVESYDRAYAKRWQAIANRLLPPNVYTLARGGLAAKYAVLSLADLRRETSRAARDPSTFARLAQPVRLAWSHDPQAAADVAACVSAAARTLLELTWPAARSESLADFWRSAFALTYGTELRAERSGRGGQIVDADPARYERLFHAAYAFAPNKDVPASVADDYWRRAARTGKRRQVAKLAKASLTFAGGVDYLAWKIERHSGQPVPIAPWQRRHPLLAAVTLFPRLLRSGAVR